MIDDGWMVIVVLRSSAPIGTFVSGNAPASEGRRAYTVMILAPPGYILPKKMAERAKVISLNSHLHLVVVISLIIVLSGMCCDNRK
jgi:hypothetical protein